MKKIDFRVQDDPTIWAKLPKNTEALMEHLFAKLFEENAAVMKAADKIGCGPYDEPIRKKLSPAQQVFVLIYRLDSQILNGGITQFCWNAYLDFYEVGKAIKKLKQTDLDKLYKKLDARLEEKDSEWLELYKKANKNPAKTAECMSKTYDLLDVRWFDKAYMSKHRTKLIRDLLQHVLKNKSDFVR